MSKYKLSDIIESDRIVINVKNRKEDIKLRKRLNALGKKWCSGTSYLREPRWGIYGEDTCYRPYGGTYGDIGWYIDNRYKVIDFNDIDLDN